MRSVARLVSGLMGLPGLRGRAAARLRALAWRWSGEGRSVGEEAARSERDVAARITAERKIAEFRTLDPWFDSAGITDVSGLKLRRSDRFGPVAAAMRGVVDQLRGVEHVVFFAVSRRAEDDAVAAHAGGVVALVATDGAGGDSESGGSVVCFPDILPHASEDEARLLVEMILRAVVPKRITVLDRIARHVVERHGSAIGRHHEVTVR